MDRSDTLDPLNPAHRELTHDGLRVSVGDRAFDLLLLLIEQRGAVVSKDRIMAVVWIRAAMHACR